MKTPRGASESSTTSDNTTEFIEIVKKYDVIYNYKNCDYKNVEAKMKVWEQIAEEIGLSVDASKRKWKNLRDSYTKYLRSFRIGTKTSKKYQYWAHADHMEFLKPYQGPGRNPTNTNKSNEDDDNECDLGYQVITKSSTTSDDGDLKMTIAVNSSTTGATVSSQNGTTASNNGMQQNTLANATTYPSTITTNNFNTTSISNNTNNATQNKSTTSNPLTTTSAASNYSTNGTGTGTGTGLMLSMPSLPTVALPPQLAGGVGAVNNKNILVSTSGNTPGSVGNNSNSATTTSNLNSYSTTLSGHPIFSMPPPPPPSLTSSMSKISIPMPASSTASSVGCLFLEPQLFNAAEHFKKEAISHQSSAMGQFHSNNNVTNSFNSQQQTTSTTSTTRSNPPLITKFRRIQPAPQMQTAAINLSFSANPPTAVAAAATSTQLSPPAKIRKRNDSRSEVDISAILQANRDLDANTLFFLSLARTVRAMPIKFQSLAKMRCMRIVSDIELELDNVNIDCNGPPTNDDSSKYCDNDTPPPAPTDGIIPVQNLPTVHEGATEHFVYVMSPSRLENMIDVSSDDEATMNGN